MADDTAALVLSLEARFDKFEKAMKDATSVVDRQTKIIEQRFDAMTKVIGDKLQSIQGTLISQTGVLGQSLAALGPIGIAAALGVGALATALNLTADAAQRVGEKAVAIKEFSTTTGFTIEETQGLRKAMRDLGIDTETAMRAFQLFAVGLNEAKTKGTGPLVDAMAAVDRSLVSQMIQSKSTAEAFTLFITALSKMSTESRNAFARMAGGRTGIGAFAEMAQDIDKFFDAWNKGTANAKPAAEIKATEETFKRLNSIQKELQGKIDALFPTDEFMRMKISQMETYVSVLTKLKDEGLLAALKEVFKTSALGQGIDALQRGGITELFKAPLKGQLIPESEQQALLEWLAKEEAAQKGVTASVKETTDALEEARRAQLARVSSRIADLQSQKALAGAAFPPAQSAELEKLLLQQKLLNEAKPTPAQQAALAAGEQSITDATRLQTIAVRERLGVATEQEILEAKLIPIRQDLENKTIDYTRAVQAMAIAEKEAKQQAEAQAVRASLFPQLTRATQDATNFAKQLDGFAVRSVDTFADALVAAGNGTKSLSDAFRDMTQSILNDIAKLLIKAALLQALNIFLPGSGTAAGGLFNIFGGNKMAGGPVTGGKTFLVGERGPELFTPSTSGFITPNSALPRTSGGTPINFGGISVDARGAAPGVGREVIEQLRAQMPGIAVAAVAQAQRYGTLRAR